MAQYRYGSAAASRLRAAAQPRPLASARIAIWYAADGVLRRTHGTLGRQAMCVHGYLRLSLRHGGQPLEAGDAIEFGAMLKKSLAAHSNHSGAVSSRVGREVAQSLRLTAIAHRWCQV